MKILSLGNDHTLSPYCKMIFLPPLKCSHRHSTGKLSSSDAKSSNLVMNVDKGIGRRFTTQEYHQLIIWTSSLSSIVSVCDPLNLCVVGGRSFFQYGDMQMLTKFIPICSYSPEVCAFGILITPTKLFRLIICKIFDHDLKTDPIHTDLRLRSWIFTGSFK